MASAMTSLLIIHSTRSGGLIGSAVSMHGFYRPNSRSFGRIALSFSAAHVVGVRATGLIPSHFSLDFLAATTFFPKPIVHVQPVKARHFWQRAKKPEDIPGEDIASDRVTDEEVSSLFSLWNSALATGDSRLVAARYTSDAVLLPTVSDTPRTTPELIKDYFDGFLLRKPQGEILESHIRIGNGWAKDSGIYEFTMGATGDKVKGRYSFVYIKEKGQWKILHHHSSVMPEGVEVVRKISKVQVQNLFNLWNDALATGDSQAVANRYAKKAVLLPTVSDVPRSTPELIKDYFDNFLLLKPQGQILESYVEIGVNWAQDVGIYEFTMGKDGSKVKGRYSFIYVFEDGQWKILHHHSSFMPEGVTVTKPVTKDEIRGLFTKWNEALATLDSTKVAARYSKRAVLLPTVSDTPRTSPELIKDYFDSFLLRKPQGVITEGHITIGANWAQDVGIYEFTLNADGSKVRARYSFVYELEDGEWKILHHHSSVMPEALLSRTA